MRKSTVFFIYCLLFVAGIAAHLFFLQEYHLFEPFWWYIVFLAATVLGLSSLGFGRTPFGIWCVGLGIFFFGVFRYSQTIPHIDEHHIAYYLGQEVSVRGVVDGLGHKREKTTAYVVRLITYNGKLLLTMPPLPAHRFGDELFIKCTPQQLSQYERWAMRDGVNAACAFPSFVSSRTAESSRENRHNGIGVMQSIKPELYFIRESFDSRLRALFSDPYGALLSGILYGDTSGISRQLREGFRITGLAHITALSGYNITIISWLLVGGLIFVGLTRRQAMPVTLILIAGFVLTTGAESSVVRAAIMGTLTGLAKGIGRLSNPRNAIALTGATMLAINPHLLVFDLGFLLSFAATVALVYFADDIERRTFVRKLPEIWEIRKAGAASVAALIFTTPILLYHTGIFGPLALLANILVVPAVPAIMALGFLAVALDFLWHPLGIAISFLARVPLEYVVSIAEYLARFGALHIRLSFLSALSIFCVIAWMMWRWKQQVSAAEKPHSISQNM